MSILGCRVCDWPRLGGAPGRCRSDIGPSGPRRFRQPARDEQVDVRSRLCPVALQRVSRAGPRTLRWHAPTPDVDPSPHRHQCRFANDLETRLRRAGSRTSRSPRVRGRRRPHAPADATPRSCSDTKPLRNHHLANHLPVKLDGQVCLRTCADTTALEPASRHNPTRLQRTSRPPRHWKTTARRLGRSPTAFNPPAATPADISPSSSATPLGTELTVGEDGPGPTLGQGLAAAPFGDLCLSLPHALVAALRLVNVPAERRWPRASSL